jgi:hypothetical protein
MKFEAADGQSRRPQPPSGSAFFGERARVTSHNVGGATLFREEVSKELNRFLAPRYQTGGSHLLFVSHSFSSSTLSAAAAAAATTAAAAAQNRRQSKKCLRLNEKQ